jgi:hypothetical protein
VHAKGHEGSERKIWKTAEKMGSVWGLLYVNSSKRLSKRTFIKSSQIFQNTHFLL